DHAVISGYIRRALPGIISSIEVCHDDEFVSFIGPPVGEDAGILHCERLDIAVWDNVQLFSHGDQLLIIVEDRILVLELIGSVDLCVIAVYRDPRLSTVLGRETGIFGIIP